MRSGRGILEFRCRAGSCGRMNGYHGREAKGVIVVKSKGQVSMTRVQEGNVVHKKVGRVSLEFRVGIGGSGHP